ncbi:MAG: LamG-like jellyroll fold domain-containing protein [Chloroflexota bacterium]|nr:LamG-like jellyroll fold domain-containing protein [Chloroflexota bacterium]
MKNSRSWHPIQVPFALLCLLTLALYAYPIATTSAQQRDDIAAVTEAWERARATGSYRYTADLVQTTIPKPIITNVGQTSHQSKVHLEGESNLPDRTMHMRLWANGGSVDDAATSAEIRIEDDRAYARQGTSEWEEIDNFANLFAPEGDFMAFLSAAKDITKMGAEEQRSRGAGGISPLPLHPSAPSLSFTRYTFRIDGLSYARYLREQIQQRMAENGELPPGVNLDLPRQYVDMNGEGELWIGSDGLPLRQIIHLQMPERPDAQIEADITVDFYDFGGESANQQTSEPASQRTLNSPIPQSSSSQQAFLFISILSLIGLMVVNSHSKKLYAALAIAVIISMVSTPLLRSIHAANFSERQAERAREQEQREQEDKLTRDARKFQSTLTLSGRPHHPNRSPLDPLPLPEPQIAGGLVRPARSSSGDELFNCRDDDGTDSDGDGLSDCQEELLNTNPNDADSDGDTITDTLEVQGFEYPTGSGTMWYSDPLEMDTNKDGIGDLHEWNWPGSEHATWDIDGDDVPDLFDLDNDDDGVPDHLDLSPSAHEEQTFSNGNPFLLQINDLEAGKPTYVEFQLRPTDPDHLWYAMNVLDWPMDNQAQMQDGDSKTFYHVDPDTALSPNSNGDLKLVPMLEIRISGSQTNLPSQEELDHYGIFVTDMNQNGSDKAVYVPLNLVTDYDDEGRAKSHVAFYAKMLYRPGDSWGNVQQVRVVWLVQALVDRCAEDGYQDGMCKVYETYNELQVVHSYYDQWTLSGLQVREDHGVDVALIYEDPAIDPNLNDDGVLFGLSNAFDHTFLAARDSDGDGQRDITIAEIYRRFNHATNGAVSEEERWGITDTLSVELHAYEHLDEALITIAMTDTEALLESVFTPHWSESAPITPTLMFAREERARTANLDVEGHGTVISWDGAQLTIDLPSSGGDSLQVSTVAGVRWSPYRFRAGWEACPIDEYWEELERRYPFDGEDDPDLTAGMMFFTQLYYLGIYQGVDSVVQLGDVPLANELAWQDAAMVAELGLAKVGAELTDKLLDPIVLKLVTLMGLTKVADFSDPERFVKLLGKIKLDKLYGKVKGWADGVDDWVKNTQLVKNLKWAFGKEGWYAGVALVVGALIVAVVVTALVAFAVYALYELGALQNIISFFEGIFQIQWVKDTLKIVNIVWTFVSAVLQFIMAIYTAITTTTMWAGVAGLIVEVVIIWIVFFIQWGVARLTPGSIEFNMLVAQTVAATVLAVLAFLMAVLLVALAGTGWGLAIAAVIMLVIALIEGVGAIFGFSPTEWITARLAEAFYNVTPMVESSVDVEPLQTGGTLLSHPERGFQAGNRVRVAMQVDTTLDTKRLEWWQYEYNTFCWDIFWNSDYFDPTAFKYKLDRGVPSETDPDELVPLHAFPEVASGDIDWNTQYWGLLDGVIDHYHGRSSQNVELKDRISLQAGINSSLPVLFMTSYSVPVIEYAGFIFYACWTRMLEGETYSDAGIVYDVFPSSLGGFYDLEAAADGGYRLSWDPAFETLKDADGDGLLSAAYDGPDPDDGKWDTDGDGFSDAYELQLRQAGSDISPSLADTDGDTLSDAEEIRLGTDPARTDSDKDGLNDDVEVNGWAFTCGTSPTHTVTSGWVTSDPLNPDSDGDGMSDLAEKTLHQAAPSEYALHPRVANPSPIAIYAALGDDDGIVAAGATVPYTAAVQNNLSIPLYSIGELTVNFPAVLDKSDIVADYTLFMGQAVTVTTDLNISAGLSSQRLDITNQMDTQLAGNPVCANIRFEDLNCTTETDNDPGTHDFYPSGSEVSISLRPTGYPLWTWNDTGITGPDDYPINGVVEFCNQETIQLKECDWYQFGCSPIILETWTVDAQVQGSFTHPVDDYPGDFVGSLDYSIYYAGGDINLSEVVPVTIDADDPITSTITSLSDGQYVQGTGETLIVGGIAQDLTSNIGSVEISLDSGAWEAATGAESWAYAWQVPASAGSHTFRTRASDVVGHVFTETTDTTVIVDAHPPDLSTPISDGDIVTATRSESGRWTVPLTGAAQDLLEPGGDPGSGVRSVQALLEGTDDTAGRDWQTATLTFQGGNSWDWNLDYLLSSLNNDDEVIGDPNGVYTLSVRASDNVGNQTSSPLSLLLRVDSDAPVATISDTGPSTTTITQSLTIGGVITDPGLVASGLAELEIAYTPQEIARAFSPADVEMLLHLDELSGTTTFRDAVGYNLGSCAGDSCPTAGESGISGTALRFDGVDDYVATTNPVDFAQQDYTISAWFTTSTPATQDIFAATNSDGNGHGVLLEVSDDGTLRYLHRVPPGVSGGTNVYSTDVYTDGRWHHLAAVKNGGSLTLYVDGAVAGSAADDTVFSQALDIAIGRLGKSLTSRYFDGLIDQVAVFERALSESEVQMLYDIAGRNWLNWQAATLSESGTGITHTTWSHVVPGDLEEGIYQIDLRGSDVLGNRNDDTSTWSQWQGEIDLHGPSVQIGFQLAGQAGDETARTEYTCRAEDFNLVEAGLDCPCPVLPSDRQYYDADWFRAWISDTARLYSIETSCLEPGHAAAATARIYACDGHGHCSEEIAGAITGTSPLDSVVFTPTYGTVLTATDPISIAGGAYANRTDGLKALTVTLDSSVIYTKTWAPGASHGEIWETSWLTPTEGAHTLLSIAADHHSYVQTDTRPITIYVDSQLPEIALPTGALTTVHRLLAGQLILTGPYTETGGVASIQVREQGGEWGDAAARDENTWRYAWFLDEGPDGEPYTLTARISDVAGRTVSQTGVITVDVIRPEPVTITLAYTDSLGAYTVVIPGHTIRDVLSPTLLIEWTASSSSDLDHYYAGWTDGSEGQIADLSHHASSDRRHEQQAGDARAYYARVVGQDVHGNRYWQTVGPVYTDVPTTSDYIADLNYRGWMESGCSQIGADRELARYAQAGQALTGTQRFYGTWNTLTALSASTDTLRLTWTGADWNSDGDLFVYFDTTPGGAITAYNPYTSTAAITMPAQSGRQLEADYLVWVQDADTATLLEWDGGAWVDHITATLSGTPHYQLDTTLHPIHTDLSLPFSWLSITETTAVKMVAFASEEGALRLWAAMPEKTPLNSEWAINTLAEVEQIASSSYALTQQYEWDALVPGLCPNAGQFTDADLLVDITANPTGVEVGYLEHDLLFLTPGQSLDADLDGELDMTLPMDTDPGLIGHGMTVTYTVHYANEGTEVAPGVRITVTARGAVQLGSDPLVLDLGDVGAGITDTVEFTGIVDTSVYTTSGEVMAIVADDTHGPFDWLWVQHDVDTVAPESIAIASPLAYVQPYTNTVRGTVYDPSGVTTVTLRSRLLPFGGYVTLDCADATPKDGQWSCEWNVGDADNGDQYTLQPLATDRFGNGPTAGDLLTVTVDTQPPTITLDLDADDRLDGAVLGPNEEILLTGQVEDDQKASGAEICIEQADELYCEQTSLKSGATTTGDWSYALQAVGELDYRDQTLSLYGIDGAGNRSTVGMSRTYKVDNVPPVVTVTTWIRYVATITPTLVLGGEVSDGGGSSDVYVIIEAPDETLTSTLAARDGDNWSYSLYSETEGVYTLRIEARDTKGNISGYGPYEVSVGVQKIYLPLVLRNH